MDKKTEINQSLCIYMSLGQSSGMNFNLAFQPGDKTIIWKIAWG